MFRRSLYIRSLQCRVKLFQTSVHVLTLQGETNSRCPHISGPNNSGTNELRRSLCIRSPHCISSQRKVLTVQVQKLSGGLCISGPHNAGPDKFKSSLSISPHTVSWQSMVPIMQVQTLLEDFCTSSPKMQVEAHQVLTINEILFFHHLVARTDRVLCFVCVWEKLSWYLYLFFLHVNVFTSFSYHFLYWLKKLTTVCTYCNTFSVFPVFPYFASSFCTNNLY